MGLSGWCAAAAATTRLERRLHAQDNWVPLHFAAYGGSTGAARELLSHGARTDAKDKVPPSRRPHALHLVSASC